MNVQREAMHFMRNGQLTCNSTATFNVINGRLNCEIFSQLFLIIPTMMSTR